MTTAIALIQRLHQHRAWVNGNLLAAAATLTDEQRTRAFLVGQGSVWKSLVHLYAAEFVWLESMLGDENPLVPGDLPGKLPGNQLGQGGITSFADLQQKWAELGRRWDQYLAGLTPESLEESIFKISTSSGLGKRFANRRYDVLLHVCTHAQYTAAQVVNMLRQLGVQQLPDTMLITLARQETERLQLNA